MRHHSGREAILEHKRRITTSEIEIDRIAQEAYVDGVPLALDEGEYELLCRFVTYTRKKQRPHASNLTELMQQYHVADPCR